MDRASDSGSEGWGFESLLAYHLLVDFGVLLVLRNFFYFRNHQQRHQKFIAFARIFGKGQSQSDMPPAYPLWLYFWRTSGGIRYLRWIGLTLWNAWFYSVFFCQNASRSPSHFILFRENHDFSPKMQDSLDFSCTSMNNRCMQRAMEPQLEKRLRLFY